MLNALVAYVWVQLVLY